VSNSLGLHVPLEHARVYTYPVSCCITTSVSLVWMPWILVRALEPYTTTTNRSVCIQRPHPVAGMSVQVFTKSIFERHFQQRRRHNASMGLLGLGSEGSEFRAHVHVLAEIHAVVHVTCPLGQTSESQTVHVGPDLYPMCISCYRILFWTLCAKKRCM